MKKIKAYQEDSFEFHSEVVKSKRKRPTDLSYIDRIKSLSSVICEPFKEHDEQFQNDNLASLSSKTFTQKQKDDLISLYDYSTKPFQRLNDILTTGENNTRQPLCPFCTINNVYTLDHLIPKSEFPEYSDHPVNLMPCCGDCNGKKSANWREGNNRKYLNLYLDELPNIQYLFVDLSIENSTIQVKYFIENKDDAIENNLYKKISNHYTDLGLCERFALNCDNTISELKNTIISNQPNLTKEQLKTSIIDTENRNRKYYGLNYWKSILKIGCCENGNVFDFLSK